MATMGGDSSFAENGALSSYSPNTPDLLRSAAMLVDKILKGADPRSLPVEQPAKFDFIINRGTARALRISLPTEVLLRVDRVID
jgi:putative ABC transport system substrate-binding protein